MSLRRRVEGCLGLLGNADGAHVTGLAKGLMLAGILVTGTDPSEKLPSINGLAKDKRLHMHNLKGCVCAVVSPLQADLCFRS